VAYNVVDVAAGGPIGFGGGGNCSSEGKSYFGAQARVPRRVPRQLEEEVRQRRRRGVGAGEEHHHDLVSDLRVRQRRQAARFVAGD
jgi:hypothetical protein